jgi:hypothetical protein
MTKADFLAGKPFEFRYREFKYSDEDRHSPTINGGFIIEGKFVEFGYEIWVEKVGTKGFEGFRYIMGKKVKVKIKFEELKLIEGVE